MDWARTVDGYCERTSAAFWAEPVNAITNAAFLLAALLAVRTVRREMLADAAALWLIALVIAIGIGSFVFHTFATIWAAVADVLPIMLFIVSFLVLTVRRFFRRRWWLAALVGILFLPAAQALSGTVGDLVGDRLSGSEGYLPALLALFVCGGLLHRHPAGAGLLTAGVVFAVSLTFRSLDEPLCGLLPLGTHFVWHLLNAVVLGTLLLTFIRHGPPEVRAA